MKGTITLDLTDNGHINCNARRNSPYAHRRKILFADDFAKIHEFVSHYVEAISDSTKPWDTD